jgi:hypothetical protein
MLTVTCYYEIPSKKEPSEYYVYISNFFKYVKSPVLFFTDQNAYEKLKPLARDNVTFHIQPFEDMYIFKEFPIEFWKDEIKKYKYPEHRHTWQLGALWSNKSGFIKQAIEIKPNYDWYMWVDAGSIRTDEWEPYMLDFGSRPLPSPGCYVQQIRNIDDSKYFQFPFIGLAGSHIVFHKNYVSKFTERYYDMVREYVMNEKCTISDQYIISSLISQKKMNELFPIMISSTYPNEWFFFYGVF